MGKVGILICGAAATACLMDVANGARHPEFQQGTASVTTVLPTLSTGIAISGGGSRSAASAIGQFRALGDLVEKFDSISTVSGGTWASSIYMFADGTDEHLLGALAVPSKLDSDALNEEPGALGAVLTAETETIAAEIIMKKYILNARNPAKLDLSSLWQETVGQAFLKPMGLDKNQYLAQDKASVNAIIDRNPSLGLSERDFIVPRTDRPKEYIMGSTLLAPRGFHATQDTVGFMQFTPSYSGVAVNQVNQYPSTLSKEPFNRTLSPPIAVGGMIETFAFGSMPPSDADLPVQHNGQVSVGIPTGKNNKFTLADATGASSAAFAATTAQTNLTSFLDPSIQYYWSAYMENTSQAAENMMLGDGGNSEETGVVALLQRKVQRIASFINTDEPIDMSIDFCDHATYASTSIRDQVSSQLVGLFQGYPKAKTGIPYSDDDSVFSHGDLYTVLCPGQTLVRQGKPFVVKTTHQVLPNARWGIEGGWQVSVVWNMLTLVSDFEDLLPLDTRNELAQGRRGEKGAFANFPFFKTMYQNGHKATAYTYPQINLLAAQQQYSVSENIDLYKSLLS